MPSKELAEKEIRAAEGIWAGRKPQSIAAAAVAGVLYS